MDEKHIAFKCTYNDGGEGIFVGFSGTCSRRTIQWNIKDGRAWCSSKDCGCRRYYDNGFKGRRPREQCYESVLFQDWTFGAGEYLRGPKRGAPDNISKVGAGKIAVLTTRFPGDKEIDRKIIGLFRIGKVTTEDGKKTYVEADNDIGIRLPLDEAKQLYYWDYKEGDPDWRMKLFRYLEDVDVAQILKDIHSITRDTTIRQKADELLKELSISHIPPPSGPRYPISGKIAKRVGIKRKYGPGGEGEDHRKLKEWIAKRPKSIGLTGVIKTEVEEHRFPSGDLPDIVFGCRKGRYAVVEIETSDPLPGAYQAIKYRSLLCAELGLPLSSSDVEAILVAWSFPRDVREFCGKYDVKCIQKRL